VAFLDAASGAALEAKGRAVVLAASTLESARLLLLSRSARHPDGLGNSSGHVGHNFCEHVMGPGVFGYVKDLVGKPRTWTTAGPAASTSRGSATWPDRHPTSSAATASRAAAGPTCSRAARAILGFGASYKKAVREMSGATLHMGGFGEVLARYENAVGLDPEVKDKWGIPVLRFSFRFGDNEKKMAADMADTPGRCSRRRGSRSWTWTARSSPKAGPSTSWARRAWAPTRARRW
jgi:choline dehydrogenase-like flavoprotein